MRRHPKPRDLIVENLFICKKCIFDSSIFNIEFDENGVCNYCKMIDDLSAQYGTGEKCGEIQFNEIISRIKHSGKRKKYDIVVGVSGGTDSSYMLVIAKNHGLRPLAVHYDNTWNTATATQNIRKITTALDVDLYTHVCNNQEADDVFKSFFYAGVPEIDGSTDIALAEVMYRAASKFGIKYVFEGHSFIEEGVAPMGKAYVDGGYIKDIHNKFGKIKMKTFPNMTFGKFIYWTVFKKIKKIRPFWYLPYSKLDARKYLEENFKWEYYGGHHLENRMTAFHHSFYTPLKFNLDQRNNTLAAAVRNGKLSRKQALDKYKEPLIIEDGILEYVMKRFCISETEFWTIMNGEKKFYTDYKTYKKRFEFFRPLFYVLAKFNLVPMSFYLKYCFPSLVPK